MWSNSGQIQSNSSNSSNKNDSGPKNILIDETKAKSYGANAGKSLAKQLCGKTCGMIGAKAGEYAGVYAAKQINNYIK